MDTALQRKSLRFRSFLWSQRWICYCEKYKCNIAINGDDTTLFLKCDGASVWIELGFVIESKLWNTAHWDKKWLVDFHAGETQLDLTGRTTAVLLIWEWMGFLRCWDYLFLLHWFRALTLSILLKLSQRKTGALILSTKFLSSRVASYPYISNVRPSMK